MEVKKEVASYEILINIIREIVMSATNANIVVKN